MSERTPPPHSPRGHALRRGRYSASGQVYLLTTVTHNRQPLFNDFDAGCIVARALACQHRSEQVQSLAWVVMPDHFHWLVAPGAKRTLAQLMQSIKTYTARSLNSREGCPGRRVWQAGFHDHAARRDEDLRKMARYIVANPLRAGLVTTIGDYPFWDAAWL